MLIEAEWCLCWQTERKNFIYVAYKLKNSLRKFSRSRKLLQIKKKINSNNQSILIQFKINSKKCRKHKAREQKLIKEIYSYIWWWRWRSLNFSSLWYFFLFYFFWARRKKNNIFVNQNEMISWVKNKHTAMREREWNCGVYCSHVRDWESSGGGGGCGEKLCLTSKIGN